MENIILELSVILVSTALFCILAEYAKQPLIVAYILAGLIIGPYGFSLIKDQQFFYAISQIGVILLLYLIGLELKPNRLKKTLKNSYLIAIGSCLSILPFGFLIGFMTNLSFIESLYLGIALSFSSTIVVLRIMHENTNVSETVYNTCVGILLIQDLLAVVSLILINSNSNIMNLSGLYSLIKILINACLLVSGTFILEKFLLSKVLKTMVKRKDLIFLTGLAWCFLLAEAGEMLHLSREIGAFIAGISLTALPENKLKIFVYKSETIRDFFMILFFFILGAQLNLSIINDYIDVILFSLVVILAIKPLIYTFFSKLRNHNFKTSKEIGLRLGQISEFSIIILTVALSFNQISLSFAMAVKTSMFISIILSNYIVRLIPNNGSLQLKSIKEFT